MHITARITFIHVFIRSSNIYDFHKFFTSIIIIVIMVIFIVINIIIIRPLESQGLLNIFTEPEANNCFRIIAELVSNSVLNLICFYDHSATVVLITRMEMSS